MQAAWNSAEEVRCGNQTGEIGERFCEGVSVGGEGRGPLRSAADDKHDGVVDAHAVQTINLDPETLYDLWMRIDLYPLWQEYLISVRPVQGGGKNITHWVMGDPSEPDGKRIEFDSETSEDRANGRISWRSVSDVTQSGEVTFVASPSGRGTIVTLIQRVKVPGGRIGNAVAATAKRSPWQTVIEDLRHFKQLAETGEIPTVKGQPHVPRGISGAIKAWMYGETVPTPPGANSESGSGTSSGGGSSTRAA